MPGDIAELIYNTFLQNWSLCMLIKKQRKKERKQEKGFVSLVTELMNTFGTSPN